MYAVPVYNFRELSTLFAHSTGCICVRTVNGLLPNREFSTASVDTTKSANLTEKCDHGGGEMEKNLISLDNEILKVFAPDWPSCP